MGTGQADAAGRGATPEQVREAERGLKVILRRRFSAAWIAENASDLMQQVNVEYAEWLEDNPPARNPVGWLLHCAEWRAKTLLASQSRRPAPTSLDEVFHLPDEATPTPEQRALDHDRHERLVKALGHLPEKERKLLALVYFRDHSIREAGRKLGWQKSAADRHHAWAMEKLRALLGEDRSLLSPAPVGLAAWAIAYGERSRAAAVRDAVLAPLREALASGAEGAARVPRHLAELARRVPGGGEGASALLGDGGGRLAGACGVAVTSVVCAIAAGGVVSGVGAKAPARAHGGQARRAHRAAAPLAELPAPELTLPAESSTPTPTESSASPTTSPARSHGSRASASASRPATTAQTIRQFGVEAGSVSAEEAAPAPASPESSSGSGAGSAGGSDPVSPAKAGNGSEYAM